MEQTSIFLWRCIFLMSLILPSQQQQTRPHIVIIVADDLGWNDVGFHGNNYMHTPNLDALAYSGVILNEYYVSPVCSPTRSALFAGRHPIHTGMWERVINATQPYGLDLSEKIMPQYLKQLGYKTHAVGKWHLGMFRRDYTPTYRGFDSFYGFWHSRIDYWNHRHHAHGCNVGLDLHDNMMPALDGHNEYATRLFTRKSIKVINEHNTTSPLFLYVAHAAVHLANHCSPLQAPQETIEKFKHVTTYEGRNVFAAMLNEMDTSVGDIVEALDKKGILDNTIIVFTTDNGGVVGGFPKNPGNNWPLRGGKATTWQGGVRGSAFIWSTMLQNTPRVSNQFFHVQDWLPTLFSAAEGPIANYTNTRLPLDGKDGWATLNDPKETFRNEILDIIDDKDDFYSFRQGKWKIVYDYDIASVQNSKAAQAISRTTAPLPANETIIKLRNDAILPACPENPPGPECNPVPGNKTICLFDMEKDHCEQTNLYGSVDAETKRKIENAFQKFRNSMAPSRTVKEDPKAFPSNWNNLWVPWKDYI
ncbi:hypothetical protein B566_EDAN004521 [Ephemera danica]|nr:hypothetical protein B566_EDAN004521 [Ephemera danica]